MTMATLNSIGSGSGETMAAGEDARENMLKDFGLVWEEWEEEVESEASSFASCERDSQRFWESSEA